jgi:5'-3' exonuclease
VTYLLIDTATVYYRSFYALPESMTAPDGHPNNAIRGTLTTLTGLVRRFTTPYIIPAWDNDWRPQWRVDLVESYKTHRLADEAQEEAEPDALGPQISAIHDLLQAVGLYPVGVDHFEADDVIASLAFQMKPACIIVTNDRDLLQCVNDALDNHLLMMAPGGLDRWPLLGAAEVMEKYGVRPEQYVDMAVLRGDPSDGLPGVPGVGVKTAQALITEFSSLDGVFSACELQPLRRPLTPRIVSNIDKTALEAARRVTTARTDLVLPVYIPWAPHLINVDQLDARAGEWGVERQAHELIKALEAAYDSST